MAMEFYLGVAPPDHPPLGHVLISSTVLRAAAPRGDANLYCGSCGGCLAESVSIAGLGSAFGSASHPLMVDCRHCGEHNVLTAETAARPSRRAA